MKNMLIASCLFAICLPLISSDDKALILPEKDLDPLFEIGKLNGRPISPDSKLEKEEFSLLSSEDRTVKVRNKREFPQVLQPGQRFAIFIENLPNTSLLLQLSVGAVINKGERDLPALSIFFNEKAIWQHTLKKNTSIVSAIIPQTYIEKGNNILQIRNSQNKAVSFDWLCVDKYMPIQPVKLIIQDLDEMKYPERNNFNTGLIDINIKGIGCKKNANILPNLSGYSTQNMIPSLSERRKKNIEFKKKFKIAIGKNQIEKKILVNLGNKVYKNLQMGMEPVVRLQGTPSEKELETITSLCQGMIFYWIIDSNNEDQIRASFKIIKKMIPDAKICVNEINNLPIILLNQEKLRSNKTLSAFTFCQTDYLPNEIWGEWSYKNPFPGLNFQKKYMEQIPIDITEWLWSGGTTVILDGVVKTPTFFDPVTANPTLPFYALKRISRTFEGNPVKINCNVLPVVSDSVLNDVFWTAVKNSEGVITIMVAALPVISPEVKLICPIPFSGDIDCEISQGFIPDTKDSLSLDNIPIFKIKKSLINVPSIGTENSPVGLFEHNLYLSNLLIIRLTKKGSDLSKRDKDFLERKSIINPNFKKGIFKISEKRPSPGYVRNIIRWTSGIVGIQSKNYKESKTDATKGTIDGVKNVVPWEEKSELLEIQYPTSKASDFEGAELLLGSGPKKFEEMYFWVYPRSKKPMKKVTLRFYLLNDGKPQFFAVDLKTDKWQRVIIQKDKIPSPYWNKICILGDPKLPEYRKGNKVSFELNGFYVLGEVHKEKGKSGLKSARITKGNDTNTLIFLGKPDLYFEYRLSFNELVKFKQANSLTPIKGINLKWEKDAQILQISGMFPDKDHKATEKLMKILTVKESKLCKQEGLIPIGIKLDFEK